MKKEIIDLEELKCVSHEAKRMENEEMYLKVIFILEEDGVKPVRSTDLAKVLKISLPSVVEMLGKMDKKGLVKYDGRKGISFKPKGKKIAKKVIRNFRLADLMLRDLLKMNDPTKYACRFEHVINDEIAEALKKVLKNPKKCIHGKIIPKI